MQTPDNTRNPVSINEDGLVPAPWRLPCKNGVIDLRTGEPEPLPADPCPAAIPHEYHGPETPCPVWEQSLREIFPGSAMQIKCFQRMCGQALVNRVDRPVMMTMTGPGGNGKSLVGQTLSGILGPSDSHRKNGF